MTMMHCSSTSGFLTGCHGSSLDPGLKGSPDHVTTAPTTVSFKQIVFFAKFIEWDMIRTSGKGVPFCSGKDDTKVEIHTTYQ